MAPQAHIASVEALADFRAKLIVYLNKARPTVAEVAATVQRTKQWLEHDQRRHWEDQLKRRRRRLEDAEQALFGARLGNLRDETSAELMAVRKAREAFGEAEGKLRQIKHWLRDFEHRTLPLVKQLEKLDTVLASDLPRGIAYLAQAAATLDAYTEAARPATGGTIPPPASDAAAPAVVPTPADAGVGEGAA